MIRTMAIWKLANHQAWEKIDCKPDWLRSVQAACGLLLRRPGGIVGSRTLAGLSVPRKIMPLPCKPDSVHPLRGWTVISLTPPERGAPLARGATITRGL